MARMYSRKHGISGSTKLYRESAPEWTRYKPKEIEMLIGKLKEGHLPAKIGLILRDSYGISDVKLILGKTITKVLNEKDLVDEFPEDMMCLMRRALKLRKHIETNKKDQTANRGLILTESKIRRLLKYYKKTNRVDSTWNYNPKNLALYVR